MTLTDKQQKTLEVWRNAGDRFAGFQIYPDGMLKVAVFDYAPTIKNPTPPMLSAFYDRDGQVVTSGYYPRILWPDVKNELTK